MNWKGTASLVVVALGLGAYVYFVESKKDAPKPAGDESTSVELWNLKGEQDVERIVLENEQGQQATYVKDAAGWHYAPKASWSLETFNWDGPLDHLKKLTAERKAEDKPGSLEPFGLASPSFKITFGNQANPQRYQVLIGGKHPLDPQHFFKTNQGEAVYTIADYKLESWQRLVTSPPLATPSPAPATGSAAASPSTGLNP